MKISKKTAAVVTVASLLAVGNVGCTSKDAAKDSMSGKFGLHGDNLTWELDGEGTLTIGGEGAMNDWEKPSDVPWYSYKYDIVDVVIENGVTSIGIGAFYRCESLTTITIPDSVTSIGEYALNYCYRLASINVDSENKCYISEEGVLFNKDKSILIQYPSGNSSKEYIVPDSVTSIGDSAFWGCDSLNSITIPDSVTSIGDGAFLGCDSLNSIIIPDGVTSIGDSAFLECESLTSITIPDSVTNIGDDAFRACQSLISITIPDSVTNIGDDAFRACQSLISITIPDSVTSIGEYTFDSCKNLKSIEIFDSVTCIGDYAFNGCYRLTSITIPDSVTTIGDGAFSDCGSLTAINVDSKNKGYISEEGVLFNKDKSILVQYPIGNSLKEYIVPDSVTSIGYGAFRECKSLTSITLPDSVTSIGDSAFSECKSLTSITLPDSVTSIGNSAFSECKSLTSITLPDSVSSIGNSAFRECESLTSIIIENPDCVIYDMNATISNNISIYTKEISGTTYESRDYLFYGTIYGYEGSTAQAYAKKYGRKFIALLSIVKQPKDVYAANGEIASVTVKATGEGLTYKWYFKNKYASEFTYTSSFTGAMYSTTMNDARDGRQLYCVITDKYGYSVKTDTVTLTQK